MNEKFELLEEMKKALDEAKAAEGEAQMFAKELKGYEQKAKKSLAGAEDHMKQFKKLAAEVEGYSKLIASISAMHEAAMKRCDEAIRRAEELEKEIEGME